MESRETKMEKMEAKMLLEQRRTQNEEAEMEKMEVKTRSREHEMENREAEADLEQFLSSNDAR